MKNHNESWESKNYVMTQRVEFLNYSFTDIFLIIISEIQVLWTNFKIVKEAENIFSFGKN